MQKNSHVRTVAVAGRASYLGSIDIDVQRTGQIVINGHCAWQVELTVQSASPVSTGNCRWGGELVHVGCACGRSVQTLLNAVTGGLDQREREIDLGDNSSDVETRGISDAAFVDSLDARADWCKTSRTSTWSHGCGSEGEESEDGCGSELHLDNLLIEA